MRNIFLASDTALSFLLSSSIKQLDVNFEFAKTLNRDDANFMAFLPECIDFPCTEPLPNDVPFISRTEACNVANQLGMEPPLQVCVAHRNLRRESQRIHCTVAPHATFAKDYFKIGDELFCASPELALLQTSKHLTDIEIIIVMSLMFGIFTKDAVDGGKLIPRRSLSSPEKVTQFLLDCEKNGAKLPDGFARLKKLIPYAVSNAASPKEIESAIRLGWPEEVGGAGFGLPSMNHKIKVQKSRRFRYCDMYWENENVCVEYDGFDEHTSPEALEHDATRGNELVVEGIQVIHLTSAHLQSLEKFNYCAGQIAFLLGRKALPKSAGFHKEQLQLKADIDAAFARFGY